MPNSMGLLKRGCHFDDLTRRFVRAEINRGADCRRAHVVRLLHLSKHHLVELVRIGEQFVVIDLHNERNLMGIFSRDDSQHAECRRNRVAAAFDGQLDDVFRDQSIAGSARTKPRPNVRCPDRPAGSTGIPCCAAGHSLTAAEDWPARADFGRSAGKCDRPRRGRANGASPWECPGNGS